MGYARDGSAPPAVCRVVPQGEGCTMFVHGLGAPLQWEYAAEAVAVERAAALAARMVTLGWFARVTLVGLRQEAHHARRTQETPAADDLALAIEDQDGWNTVDTVTPGYGAVTIDIDEEWHVGLGHRVFDRVIGPHVVLHDDTGRAPGCAEIHKHCLVCGAILIVLSSAHGTPHGRRPVSVAAALAVPRRAMCQPTR